MRDAGNQEDREHEAAPEDRPGEPGAEGGSKGSGAAGAPGMPEPDDDSPLGDTDQHSDA